MSIAFIASSHGLIELDMAREELERIEKKIKIVYGHLSQSIPVAKKLAEQGVQVIIARGATASYLKSGNINTPVVELPITLVDLSRTLMQAAELAGKDKPRVGALVFSHMQREVEALAPLAGFEIQIFPMKSDKEAEKTIDFALQQGMDVLLGGVLVYETAKRRNLPAVLIQSGSESFWEAYRQAEAIAYARALEKQRVEEMKAILNYTYGGIIGINDKGLVHVFNNEAERITGIKSKDALNKHVKKLFPHVNLLDGIKDGEKQLGELIEIGPAKVLMRRIPICVDGNVTGMVATFQEINEIEKMESKIRENIYNKGLVAKFSFSDLIGESLQIKETIATAAEYAKTNSAVLITGESGVGKELFAQSIHRASSRKNGPFVAVNCAALPDNLLESELFGYVEGAFTGATRKGKKGLFELAHEGTIFLDEISEIPLSLQGRLLRVLQESEVMRLGHDRVIPINIRVICATNRNLKTLVSAKAFREDLYWRLNVLNLKIPPLRERREDTPILIEYFLHSFSKTVSISNPVMELLTQYAWPGNVRELENFCERLAVIAGNEKLTVSAVKKLLDIDEISVNSEVPDKITVKELEPEIQAALEKAGGNMGLAAELLGIHRTTLWRRIKQSKR